MKYLTPEVELLALMAKDVIASSQEGGDDNDGTEEGDMPFQPIV